MYSVLMVPVHLDALWLETDRSVVSATTDFTRLPYFDGEQDRNPDIANISEEIVSQPFQNQNLLLKAGIHLHWALPDALTQGMHDEQGTRFPIVPNRWLVTRTNTKNGSLEKQSIVESDYLSLTDNGSVSFPPPTELANEFYQPFCYLGRKREMSTSTNFSEDTQAKRLATLTAVGYGEPTFAAFYPNCHSVFGIYDDYKDFDNISNLQYDLLGWYSKPEQDCLNDYLNEYYFFDRSDSLDWLELQKLLNTENLPDFIGYIKMKLVSEVASRSDTNALGLSDRLEIDESQLIKTLNKILIQHDFYQESIFKDIISDELKIWLGQMPLKDRSQNEIKYLNRSLIEASFPQLILKKKSLKQAIQDEFKWYLGQAVSDAEFPERIVCYARLTFKPKPEKKDRDKELTQIIVGNTGTEALSAYLAHTISNDPDRQSTIEDQLEAVQLSSRLANRQLDVGFKFEEARHEKGFNAIDAGSIWTIRLEKEASAPANATESAAQEQIALSDELAHLLNELNVLQQACDREAEKLESIRRQLFSDWYKYMLCAYPPEDSRDEYPDIDEVRYYIETKGIAPLQRKQANFDRLTTRLNKAVAELSDRLNQWNADVRAGAINSSIQQPSYTLKQISAPRFWQPTEPVVLMTGEAVQASLRHGQDGRLREDGLLECHILSLNDKIIEIASNLEVIRNTVANQQSTLNPIAFSVWTGQPWNPFLLEWEVEVFPVENQGNLDSQNRRYDEAFISENYKLAEENCELAVQQGKGSVTKAANVYSGSSILTPHAGIQLKERIEAYFKEEIFNEYLKVEKKFELGQAERDEFFKDHLTDILKWYKKTHSQMPAEAAIWNIISAYEHLTSPDFHCLSQSLGGFNESLLMHKQTLQLGIADPLGFNDYQDFAEAVRVAVGSSIRSAPEPLNDFNPIRSGVMQILRLRLVDTFGKVQDLDVSQVLMTEQLTAAGDGALISLPPRLVQPARLNFRWLSASQGEQEMNDHPATTPICGWVLPNNLDNSLMIHDNNGKALGSIDENAHWEPAPMVGVAQNQIANPHLQRMVNYLIEQGADFLEAFISTLDRVVDNIEPENFAQHPGLALLMGSPLALVRASLNLELQGLPAVNQDWNVFRWDMQQATRETDGFTEVQFPIRIGEYKQLNDGLVGYWQETSEGYKANIFYAPQDPDDEYNPYIRSHTQEPLNLMQSIASPPQILVMLIDPRGKVHATSGVLPTKAIDIPPDRYATALQQIEITFLSTPILIDRFGQQPVNSLLTGEPPVDQRDTPLIHLPLPGEPGYEWSWVYRERGTWREGSIGKVNLEATFSGQQEIREGWLKLKPAKRS